MKNKDKALRIELDPGNLMILKNRGMNWSVKLQAPFDFEPSTFTSNIEGLKPKQFSKAKQLEMMEDFLEDPFKPVSYCLVSAPNDGMAKLLAAWMMQYAMHKAKSRSNLPLWVDLMGGFDNKWINQRANASLLVLNNVGTTSTQPKMEKLRDLLETYTEIPRIVVATGCDPYAFFTQYLYLPLHKLAYLTTSAVKRTVEL